MTAKQKAAIKFSIKQKYLNGEITQAEYDSLVRELEDLANAGASQEYAKTELGLYKNGKMPKRPATSSDPGHAAANKAVEDLEKRLKKTYQQAQEEIAEKLGEWSKRYAEKDARMRAKLAAGEITPERYKDWQMGQVFIGDLWSKRLDQASGVLLDANRQAMAVVNDQKMGVFAENANFQSYQLTQDAKMDLSFAVYDVDAVARLVRDQPELLPRKVVNGVKDKAWNQTKMANIAAQGIIQGDSIPEIVKRIAAETASDNMLTMLRYARTAMTSAQNAGRMETLHRAKEMGIQCKKVWLATLDRRTRDSHRNLDGQVRDIDEYFDSDFGKIMFPGDPEGKPGDVYNCRCTLTYEYEGYPADPANNQRLMYEEWDEVWYTTEKDKNGREYQKEHVKHHRESKLVEDMTYNEWKSWKASGGVGQDIKELEKKKTTPEEKIRELIAKHTGNWNNDELREVGKLAHEMVAGESIEVYDSLVQSRDEKQKELDVVRADLDAADRAIRRARAQGLPSKDVNEKILAYNNLIDKYNDAVRGLIEAKNKVSDAEAERMTKVVSRIRSVGGVDNNNMKQYMAASKRSKTTDEVILAMNGYPSEWLIKSGQYGLKLKPKWSEKRAHYSPGNGEIIISARRATNVHELGHRFEQVVPGIREAERAYYAERTAGEALEWLGPGYDYRERTRKDKFIDPYMGKDYGGQAFELVSMGFEYAYSDYEKLSQDEDMRDWILGILMCV